MAIPQTPPLGELEIQVLEYLWSIGEANAKMVHEHCEQTRNNSLNTVQSALERLYRKGLLLRNKHSHSYLYSPTTSREELLGQLINDVVGRFQVDSQSSAAAIVNAAEQIDDKALDLLEQAIKQRRMDLE